MAKIVYGEDELRKTRARLSVNNEEEAKFMMKVLGGEVGEVRSKKPETVQNRDGWNRPYTKQSPLRRVETADFADKDEAAARNPVQSSRFVWKPLSYRERVKMDAQEARAELKIKTWTQALRSKLTFFKTPPDVVSRYFITSKMDDYFLPLKKLVSKTRLVFPRNNSVRNKKLKEEFPFAFSVLDTIRYWKVEKISALLTQLQAHPRSVVVSDFAGIIKEFYRPLFILGSLDPDVHIAQAVQNINQVLQNEPGNPISEKMPDEIVELFNEVNEDTRYRLYPFLLKFVSSVYLPYGTFFAECEQEILVFLGIDPEEIIKPPSHAELENAAFAEKRHTTKTGEDFEDDDLLGLAQSKTEEESVLPVSPSAKPRAVQRGIEVLEQLFPEAGWNSLDMFPDLYPYFVKSLPLKRNADILDPENPMLQALILMQILEELFYGFRSISFNEAGFDLAEFLGIIDEWHTLIENGFERLYLPRIAEFAKLFYNQLEAKQRSYAAKVREELNWTARLFLLPCMKIDMFAPLPAYKKDITAVFPKIRALRQDFTIIAGEIEKAMKAGGASVQAHCAAINNPWNRYVFQVENPLSKRLNALLGKENRTNVSLVYYALSVLSVLDYFLNSANSWAYKTNTDKLFRSQDDSGLIPQPPPETAIDADAIFKQSIGKLKSAQGTAKKQSGAPG
jgi:hypothetical protein